MSCFSYKLQCDLKSYHAEQHISYVQVEQL